MDGGAWWAVVHVVARSQTQLSDFTFTFHFHALEKEMATHSGVLAWRVPGTGEPGALLSMGSHRVRHDWSDLAAAATCMEMWKTMNRQTNLEKEKWIWRNQAPWLQTKLRSYSNQNSIVLAHTHTHRNVDQWNRIETRDKPMHLWSPNLWQRRQEYTMEKR